MEGKKEAEPMIKEKQVTAQFVTKLAEKYHVPDSPITLDTGMGTKELNEVMLDLLNVRL